MGVPQGPQSVQFKADIAGVATDFVLTDFGSELFVVITQIGKIGSLIEATASKPKELPSDEELNEPIYHVKVLFGDRQAGHYRAYARAIIECVTKTSSKSVLLGIALKEHTSDGLRQIIQEVRDHITPAPATSLSD